VNCCVLPAAIETLPGVTEIEASATAVTVNVAEPWSVPKLAVIVVVPGATLVAKPVWILIVATEVDEDVQLADVVRSFVVPSV
jgi:hypothetical protein